MQRAHKKTCFHAVLLVEFFPSIIQTQEFIIRSEVILLVLEFQPLQYRQTIKLQSGYKSDYWTTEVEARYAKPIWSWGGTYPLALLLIHPDYMHCTSIWQKSASGCHHTATPTNSEPHPLPIISRETNVQLLTFCGKLPLSQTLCS